MGILLAHARDSEPRQLCEHFAIPLSVLLAGAEGRAPGLAELLAALAQVPAGEVPPLDPDARMAIDHAATALPRDDQGLLTLAAVFGGVLGTTSDLALALGQELERRQVEITELIETYPRYLGERRSYREFLAERHPYSPPQVAVTPYVADHPGRRRRRGDDADDRTEAPQPADLVGVSREVDAFAYLIASRALAPPLAIGLFGDWGSGKSWFMRSLQRRVDSLLAHPDLKDRAAEELPFHRSVVQVEFNAWQYVEGNLWASLLDHLFRNLSRGPDEDDLLQRRQEFVAEQLDEAGKERAQARIRRDEAASEQRQAAAEVRRRRAEREARLAELEAERRKRSPLAAWHPSKNLLQAINRAAEEAGVGPVVERMGDNAEELRGALGEAAATWQRTRPVVAVLRTKRTGYLLALAAALLLTPTLVWLLDQLNWSAVSTAAGGLAGLLATATAVVRMGTSIVASGLDQVALARSQLDQEVEASRRVLDQHVAQAVQRLAEANAALEDAEERERATKLAVARAEAELSALTPARVLDEFITERLGSDDYRRHLGVPAIVRRDLERLSQLVEHQNSLIGSEDGSRDERAVNRIVLYIDDLDRCPTHLVVKVLQAVHLLLAFPLFVVVVAVDSRWLAGALREHYGELLGTADSADPDDYLEKIFQVPFWVRPLAPDVRKRMASGLLAPSLRPPDLGGGDEDGGSVDADLPSADDPELLTLIESFTSSARTDPWTGAAALTVTGEELRFVEEVAPLLGDTPRSVKRFVNVYLLLKAVAGAAEEWPADASSPEPHKRVVFLLAVATGQHDLAGPLFDAIEDGSPAGPADGTLSDALASLAAGPDRTALDGWLAAHAEVGSADRSGLARWTPVVRRFSFGTNASRAAAPAPSPK